MKPRIEKKLSKALVAIFQGTKVLDSAWIDSEYCREPIYEWSDRPRLTPRQVRYNRECRVAVNHMPSIGGELDYWGEGSDWRPVHSYYLDSVYGDIHYGNEELFRLTHRFDDDLALTPEQVARRDGLLVIARRHSRRMKNGRHLLAHARDAAAVAKFEESIRADQLAASKAKWAAEAAARKATPQPQPEGTPA